MCGVIGIFGRISLKDIVTPLQLLTHRGQDATGLAWASSDGIKTQKCFGYVDNLKIDEHETTDVCIGATRYPTAGASVLHIEKFSQPYTAQTPYGMLCLTHNGNIANMMQIAERLGMQEFGNDTELIAHLLADLLSKNKGDMAESVSQMMLMLDGSYSITCIFNDKLVVFRDPKGIRPLFLAKTNTHVMTASETVCFQLENPEYIRDVEPGELIIIGKDGMVSKKLRTEKNYHCMFEYVYFSHPTSTVDGRNVYDVRIRLGEKLAKQIMRKGIKADMVACVPETSRPAAQKMAEMLGLPFRDILIRNWHVDRTFIMKDQKTREVYASRKYLVNDYFLKGRKVLIVDDSIVRGTTSKKIIELLRNHGAEEVHLAITCPPIISPCYYGIDFATYKELAAHGKSVEAIREMINADSLTYQTIDDLKEAIGLPDLCTACLTKEYPTPYGAVLNRLAEDGRLSDEGRHYQHTD
ncbi:MAG: amidophosphoribosyltransferase [Candidatus Aenigmarchaeota archaeon]|nr:amidophosphoribosyltransferase [Candidatus Aenigmarchaeota archaeon]